MYQLTKSAESLARKNKYEQAFGLLTQADEGGDPVASYALGTWYLHGLFVKKDLKKGFQYLRKASRGNVKEAFFDLGICYEKGAGTEKNLQRAFKSYLAASILGDKDAEYEIVRCFYYGIGVEKNRDIATLMYERVFGAVKNSSSSGKRGPLKRKNTEKFD